MKQSEFINLILWKNEKGMQSKESSAPHPFLLNLQINSRTSPINLIGIYGQRNIGRFSSPAHATGTSIGRVDNPPAAIATLVNGDIRLSITIVIPGHRGESRSAPSHSINPYLPLWSSTRRGDNPPGTSCGIVNGNIGLSIPIIISRDRFESRSTPAYSIGWNARRGNDPPRTALGIVNCNICFSISIDEKSGKSWASRYGDFQCNRKVITILEFPASE